MIKVDIETKVLTFHTKLRTDKTWGKVGKEAKYAIGHLKKLVFRLIVPPNRVNV